MAQSSFQVVVKTDISKWRKVYFKNRALVSKWSILSCNIKNVCDFMYSFSYKNQ